MENIWKYMIETCWNHQVWWLSMILTNMFFLYFVSERKQVQLQFTTKTVSLQLGVWREEIAQKMLRAVWPCNLGGEM